MNASPVLPPTEVLQEMALRTLTRCGVDPGALRGGALSRTPITGRSLHPVTWTDAAGVDHAVGRAQDAFRVRRTTPAPARVT